jgi:uncharacterized membrane protein
VLGSRLRQVFGYLISGILVLLPAVVCLWVASAVVRWVVMTLGPDSEIARNITGHVDMGVDDWLVLGALYAAVIIAITLLGYLTSLRARNIVTDTFKVVFSKFPVLDRIYSAVDQVGNVIRQQPVAAGKGGLAKFGDVAVVRFSNLRFMGVLTSRKVYRFGDQDYVQVLMPSSPMPASGFLYLAPVEDVYLADLNIEEFTKVVVSFGSLTSQVFEREVKIRPVSAGHDPDTQRSQLVTDDEE